MRKYPTDYRLWAIITGVLFVVVMSIWLVVEGIPTRNFPGFLMDLMLLSGACAFVGWAFQATAVVFGIRLVNRPDPQQEADYDDCPGAGPPDR